MGNAGGGIIATTGYSQSQKYLKAMEAQVPSVDTIITVGGWAELANTFQRIADAEKTEWLPYYYAALSHAMTGYHMLNGQPATDKIDAEADKAEDLLKKAEAISKDNSEIFVVKKMMQHPANVGRSPKPLYDIWPCRAGDRWKRPEQLNPANPRVALLEGQDKFYTPEQFGGSKTEAKAIFEDAMKKYEAFKPESSISPNWGLRQVKWLYSQCK